MKYLFFFFFSVTIYAQNMVSGNIISENGYVIQNVTIININSGDKTSDNSGGFFKIKADINDELRFVKENFERRSIIIQSKNFLTPLSVQLIAVPTEVEEVKIGVKLTGDLEKDSKKFNPSYKVVALNKDIREYVKKPMAEIRPKNSIPSSFAPRDLYAGQLNLLSISFGDNSSGGIFGLLLKESFQKENLKLSLSEKENFYKKVKENFYGKYFEDYGLDEFKFESYLVYLDNKYGISAKYHDYFNKFELEKILKNSLKEFTK
jgi:hypothetical protein